MALLKANGLRVLSAKVLRPAYGVWSARLRIDTPDALTGRVTLVAPNLTLVGTADPMLSGAYQHAAELLVVGGAGGMRKTATARDYVATTVGGVLAGLAVAAGETLSSTISADLLGTQLAHWTVRAAPVAFELRALLDTALPGKRWRILEDGKLWIGEHAWSEAPQTFYTITDDRPGEAHFTVAADRPFLTPGQALAGRRLFEVVDTFEPERVRHAAHTDESFADVVGDVARAATAGTIEPLRLYPARVVGQPAGLGGALELLPDDTAMPGMSKVPIRVGIPGVKVRVASGARVLFTFEGGDRRRPVVVSWEDGDILELAFAGGTQALARVGDQADAGTLYYTTSGSPPVVVALAYIPPGGTPLPPPAVPLALKAVINANGVKIKA